MNLRYIAVLVVPALIISCKTEKPTPPTTTTEAEINQRLILIQKNREVIEEHVANLAQSLVEQPVMTPRSGFSGYLAHFKVIRTTTKDSPFAVIIDGEGHDEANTPAELLDFAKLKGKHPYGGTYAFSSNDKNGVGKDRHDSDARLILEIPGSKGDGLMTIGYADGEVVTVKAPESKLDDTKIQEILSVRGKP